MKKMQIILDEDKIRREGVHEAQDMQAVIDEILVDEGGLVKGEGGFYYPNDYEDGFVAFMSSALILKDCDWFLDNVDTWLWYNSDDYPADCCVEDARAFFLAKRQKPAFSPGRRGRAGLFAGGEAAPSTLRAAAMERPQAESAPPPGRDALAEKPRRPERTAGLIDRREAPSYRSSTKALDLA